MEKRICRQQMLKKRNALSQEEIKEAGIRMAESVLKLPAWERCDSVYCFASYGSEIDTIPLCTHALNTPGKLLAMPRVEGERMVFYTVSALSMLQPGYRGIPEPISEQKAEGKQILLILPGLAFDGRGNRLGYGGGFYDRYIKEYSERICCRAGVGFAFQLLKELPVDSFDEKIECLVTPEQVITFNN